MTIMPDDNQATSATICLRAEHLYLGHRGVLSGDFTLACADLNLDVMEHEFVTVVGPSGCGKTTFLEATAGLVPVAGGSLSLHGAPISGPGHDRSLVFQQPSLFPWRTVKDNVLFGLEAQARLDGSARSRADALLEIVGMSGAAGKYPHELSGGMQQRVNLARALATDPTLLLLDEPFSSLDAQTREVLQDELLAIWQAGEIGDEKTALFVTHDVPEAVLLADRVIVFGPAPAGVAREFVIDAPRPRDPDWKRSDQFGHYCDAILEELHQGSPRLVRS
jgi:NitT/TauT family transport system ATP-binding protein